MLERRGEVERLEVAGSSVAATCLARAEERLTAARLLLEARLWPPAYTSAYDAYRMAAEAIVVALGYRVPAVAGAHRITLDIARAAIGDASGVFAAAASDRFRAGRHEAEYFDPDRPSETTEADGRWALERAPAAIRVVTEALA